MIPLDERAPARTDSTPRPRSWGPVLDVAVTWAGIAAIAAGVGILRGLGAALVAGGTCVYAAQILPALWRRR